MLNYLFYILDTKSVVNAVKIHKNTYVERCTEINYKALQRLLSNE